TEIIFCDDKSIDGTAEEIRRVQALHPDRDIKLYQGPGINKASNVRTGFDRAEADILMILDADLTTTPEQLHYFYDPAAGGRAGFASGWPFTFPTEGVRSRPANLGASRLSRRLVPVLRGRPASAPPGAAKGIGPRHWPAIRAPAGSWGTGARWGDYDLL